MRRSRQKLYDSSLIAAALGLLFLYVTDPYNKLSSPPYHDPQNPGSLDDVAASNVQKLPDEPQSDAEDQRRDDYRSLACRKKIHQLEFTKVSIIITVPDINYLDMTLTSLERNTPAKYIHEVIVVDHGDFSTKDLEKLEGIVSDIKDGRFVRNNNKGHVSARLLTSDQAQGDVLIFIEAGVLLTFGWLEPILDTLIQNPQAFVMPNFDKISSTSPLTYEENSEQFVPYIDRQLAIKMKATEAQSDIIPVATIRREMFAVKTLYFRHIGKLSSDVGDMGGVHQELALRVWQCGGSILLDACSHVGIMNFFSPLIVHNPLNIWRISEMWINSTDWDPLSSSNTRPNPQPVLRKQIKDSMAKHRQKLHCETSPKKFIEKFLPRFDLKPSQEDLKFQQGLKSMVARAGGRSGLMRSKSAQQCLSPDEERFLRLGPCDPAKAGVPRADMTFRFTHLSQIKVNGRCVTVAKNNYLRVMDCDNANEKWNYREQQSFIWEDSGKLLFWISKDCIMHVSDPDPTKNGRPIGMKRNCNRNDNVDFSTWEILY